MALTTTNRDTVSNGGPGSSKATVGEVGVRGGPGGTQAPSQNSGQSRARAEAPWGPPPPHGFNGLAGEPAFPGWSAPPTSWEAVSEQDRQLKEVQNTFPTQTFQESVEEIHHQNESVILNYPDSRRSSASWDSTDRTPTKAHSAGGGCRPHRSGSWVSVKRTDTPGQVHPK